VKTFLVGFDYHEPEPYALWQSGLLEDFESSTGIFVNASSSDRAVDWASYVAQQLLRHENQDSELDWCALGYTAWIEDNPESSGWSHCLDFFQHVIDQEMPDLKQMGTKAYQNWLNETKPAKP
jgi:hypothetical protein